MDLTRSSPGPFKFILSSILLLFSFTKYIGHVIKTPTSQLRVTSSILQQSMVDKVEPGKICLRVPVLHTHLPLRYTSIISRWCQGLKYPVSPHSYHNSYYIHMPAKSQILVRSTTVCLY